MEQFETCGEVNLSQEILEGLRNVIIETVSVSDLEISLTIQRCYRQYQYVACPHTATAISYVFSRIDRFIDINQIKKIVRNLIGVFPLLVPLNPECAFV